MKHALIACLALTTIATSAQAADCGKVYDELATAISGHLTMSPEKKQSMMRMASTAYDHCVAGDTKYSGNIRDMLMTQIKESLGGRN